MEMNEENCERKANPIVARLTLFWFWMCSCVGTGHATVERRKLCNEVGCVHAIWDGDETLLYDDEEAGRRRNLNWMENSSAELYEK